jgi:hypothetical protein
MVFALAGDSTITRFDFATFHPPKFNILWLRGFHPCVPMERRRRLSFRSISCRAFRAANLHNQII